MIKFVKYLTAIALLSTVSVAAGEEKAATCTKNAAECSSQKQLTLKIDSAACSETCANLDKVLTSLEGVKAESCSESHLTKVSYDASKVKPEQVFAAFKKAGVKVEGQQVQLAVNGMACSSCSSKLTKALTKLEGVVSGAACHESKKATVIFDPAKLKTDQIVAAINATGYKVASDAPAAN